MKKLDLLININDKIRAKQLRRTNKIAEYVLSNQMIEIFFIQKDDNGDEVYAVNNDFINGIAWNFPSYRTDLINKRWARLT
jgi:hypothetical protein